MIIHFGTLFQQKCHDVVCIAKSSKPAVKRSLEKSSSRNSVAVSPVRRDTRRHSEMQPGAGKEAIPTPVVQYVVLRRDLWTSMGWPLGSVVAQACHAATAALWESREEAITQQYCSPQNLDKMHKVILETKSFEQLQTLAQKLQEGGVRHKLWIEQPEDIPTCIAVAPYVKSDIQQYFKKLKLCSS